MWHCVAFFSLLNITLALLRKIFYCVFLWQLQKIYIVTILIIKSCHFMSRNQVIYSLSAFKWHKSDIKNLLMKSSEIMFIFLPAFCLIIWLMASPKNFEKISILKLWQLVFFWGVKTHFGKLPLKSCIFRDDKYIFSPILPL